jgi:hypothetical protein
MFGRMFESLFFWPNDGSAGRLKIMPCQKRFSKKSFCRFNRSANFYGRAMFGRMIEKLLPCRIIILPWNHGRMIISFDSVWF